MPEISTAFEPEEFPPKTASLIVETNAATAATAAAAAATSPWEPIYRQTCAFGPQVFTRCMLTFIRNPNLNTSWLFRGDVVYDDAEEESTKNENGEFAPDWPARRAVAGMTRRRTVVRRLVPRNERRDAPMLQSCEFHQTTSPGVSGSSTLLLYIPHITSAETMPFYHPKVAGIAHLHEWDAVSGSGAVSVHLQPFSTSPSSLTATTTDDPRLRRIAYHLLERLHRHGTGSLLGYTKRVHHDLVVAQARVQTRYARLKARHATTLLAGWAESTDPTKHVFEDLGIAAFLMELWADMYDDDGDGSSRPRFPGFVDVGCGNGLLVHILNEEGYRGWGFDARARRSWAAYGASRRCGASPTGTALAELHLVPTCAMAAAPPPPPPSSSSSGGGGEDAWLPAEKTHDGRLERGTFVISNHADELTPWTPVLAAVSGCPFLAIPCCSRDLAGRRFRAPPPRGRAAGSTYRSLVDWVARIAEDCGWVVETEALRIPSTRNVALLGRRRRRRTGGVAESASGGGEGNGEGEEEEVDVAAIVDKYGGVEGYYTNIAKLVKSGSGPSH